MKTELKLCTCKEKYGRTDPINFTTISNSEYDIAAVLDEEEIRNLVNTEVHSVHYFPSLTDDERAAKANVRNGSRTQCSFGLIIDVDNELHDKDGKRVHNEQLKLEDAAALLDETGFAYAIYSSKSDRRTKEKHTEDGKVDRYHILVPFAEPLVYSNKEDRLKYRPIYDHFVKMFNGYADTACSDLARIIYPTRRDDIRTHLQFIFTLHYF